MLGIIVGTHGHLAEELVNTCAMICGQPDNLTTVTLVPGEGPEDLMAKYNKAMEEMDTTNGVIILNDLFSSDQITSTTSSSIFFSLNKNKSKSSFLTINAVL